MLSFVEFVQTKIGTSPEAIAHALSLDIAEIAGSCRIDWHASKSKICYDGSRQYSPAVKGLTIKDNGRVYLWANIKRHIQSDGTYIDYPVIVFKSYQSTYNEPSASVNTLNVLFELYKNHKETGQLKSQILKVDEEKIAKDLQVAAQEAAAKKIKVNKHLQKEKLKFLKYPSLGSMKSLYSPYLSNKNVAIVARRNTNIKIGNDKHGYFTVFPLKNIRGEFQGLQRIYHNTPSGWDDNKIFSWGMNTTGAMFVIGDLEDAEMCYIAEGLATGLSVNMATGKTVVVALNANNLTDVSKAIKEKHPTCKRVHISDNDHLTKHHGNTGIYKAALSVKSNGGFVFVPKVKKGKDANDVHVNEGLAALRKQILDESNYFNGRLSQNVDGIFNWI